MRWVYQFVCDESGQDLVEYSFLALFIALALIVGMQALAASLNSHFNSVVTQLGTGS